MRLYQSRPPPSLEVTMGLGDNKSGSLATPASNCLKNYFDFLVVFLVEAPASLGLNEASFFINRPLRRAALFL